MEKARVTITEEGRSGPVICTEASGSISGSWEFAGGDALAIVYIGSANEWKHGHPWALERRVTFLRFVAGEVIRQKASGCKSEIDEE